MLWLVSFSAMAYQGDTVQPLYTIHVSNFQKYVFTCSSFNEIQRQNKSSFLSFFSHTGVEYHIWKGGFHPVIEINFCGCHGRGTKDNWVTGDQRHFGWPKPPKSKELGGPKCRWDQRTRWTKSSRNNLIYYRKLSVIQVHRKVIQFWLGYLMFYSKHHAAERWDLEFGSNTTEKIENSLKKIENSRGAAQRLTCLYQSGALGKGPIL